jgi:hypothetical protein
MRFLVTTPNKQFLNTLSSVFRHTTCNNTWAIGDLDLYDDAVRRKLPNGTIWVKPSTDEQGSVLDIGGELIISVPIQNRTFESFNTALHVLESVKAYRAVDWVAITPFGPPDPFTAWQMRNAYVDFIQTNQRVTGNIF